jgi:TRAP transporter TAXI family solute receptor
MQRLAALAFFVGMLAGTVCAEAQQLGIVTGGPTGTYIRIGQNIRDLVAPQGITLDVRESKGSIENVYAVRQTPGVQLAIVQSDVLQYIRRIGETNPERSKDMRELIDNTKLVFPLYNEEIHVLARPEIRSLADLAGKRVAIGPENSGTFLTAVVLFSQAGVTASYFPLPYAEALAGLRRGDLEAMVYVAGQPAKIFVDEVKAEDGLNFVPIIEPAVLGFYNGARIERESYPWLAADVDTVAVKALLVAYNYRGENCQNIGKLAKLVYDGIESLKKNGHPKWKVVNLDLPLETWDRYDCVATALGQPLAPLRGPDKTDSSAPPLDLKKLRE